MDREQTGAALGRISSGLYIATSTLDGAPVGMLASFVEQASFEPPMVTIAVQPGRLLDRALAGGQALGLNVLGEGSGPLMKPFIQPDNDDPFAGIDVELDDGTPPRLPGATAFLHATPRSHLDAGDHRVYLCEVVAGTLHHPDVTPMVRHRKSGFGY